MNFFPGHTFSPIISYLGSDTRLTAAMALSEPHLSPKSERNFSLINNIVIEMALHQISVSRRTFEFARIQISHLTESAQKIRNWQFIVHDLALQSGIFH